MPGPWSTTRTRSRSPTARARSDTGSPVRVADRVLEHVHERTLELARIGLQRRQLAVDRDLEGLSRCTGHLDGLVQHVLQRAPRQARRGAAGLQQREVQQLLDQHPQPRARHRARARAPRRRSRPPSARGSSVPAAREDRRDGRAQVVGDRAQHGRLHLVRAPQGGRLDHLSAERLAVHRRGEDRGQRRDARARARARAAPPGRRRAARARRSSRRRPGAAAGPPPRRPGRPRA